MVAVTALAQTATGQQAPAPKAAGKAVTEQQVGEIARREAADAASRIKDTYDKQLLEIAEQKLKLGQALVSGFAWGFGITSAIVGVLGFMGFKLSAQWLKTTIQKSLEAEMEKTAQAARQLAQEKVDGVISNFEKGQLLLLHSKFLVRMGFLQWELASLREEAQRKALVRFAIIDTEKALELCPEGDELFRIYIKSNLAYYYAEIELMEKKQRAIAFAKEARDFALKPPGSESPHCTNWLANECYVRLRYAEVEGELARVVGDIRELKALHVSLSEELDRYLVLAESKIAQITLGAAAVTPAP